MQTITLAQVRAAFPRGALKNGESLTYCPCDRHKNKPKLSVTEENGRLLAHCLAGCDQNRVWQAVKSRVSSECDGLQLAPHVRQPDTIEQIKWPEWLPQYPNGWKPISQVARDQIAAKRKDYTPSVEA